jgi:ferritin-like protein
MVNKSDSAENRAKRAGDTPPELPYTAIISVMVLIDACDRATAEDYASDIAKTIQVAVKAEQVVVEEVYEG